MSYPTTFEPMKTAVEEVLISGSGQTNKTIPTGSFSLEWWNEGRENESLGKDTLAGPQARFYIDSFDVADDTPNTPSSIVFLDVSCVIDLAYSLDSQLLKNRRFEVRKKALDDAMLIRNALCHPGNLDTDLGGEDTGVISGTFLFEGMDEIEEDYENGVITLSLDFRCKMAMSTNTP